MIDLTKPIRLINGALPARVLATDLEGDKPICIACYIPVTECTHTYICTIEGAQKHFENLPLDPATVCLYVWWDQGSVSIVSANAEDAQRWRANGWKVSEHLVTEPPNA